MRVAQTIPNLVQGVSQQPSSLRRNTQAEAQDNSIPSVSQGQVKRPPSEHLAKISSDDLSNAFIHTIHRDDVEKYTVLITDGDLKVFDLSGVERTVSFPDGKTYLSASNSKSSFKATTVADFTFIVNKTKETAMTASTSTAKPEEALVYVALGVANKSYRVTIGGQTATVKTGTTASASLDTSDIAEGLLNGTAPSGGSFSGTAISSMTGVTATRYGNVIHITQASSFDVSTEDGYGGTAMYAIADKIQRFSDLPNDGPSDYIIEVIGDVETGSDNYFVKLTDNGGSTPIWEETVEPGNLWEIDKDTMPFTLISNADGTFTFQAATWAKRLAGDSDTSPDPSFIGAMISDVFFFKNRLGFLSDENIIMSEAGEFFNFFRTTVTTLLDSDPIDVSVSHVKVSILRNAIPFNKNLLVFSDNTQFKISGDDILSPKTISVTPITEYENQSEVVPEGLGKTIYFPVEKGVFSSVMEYFIEDESGLELTEASEVTEHVPKYIPGGIFKMAGTSTENALIALTSQAQNHIYLYKYFWRGREKLQSSWCRWIFDSADTILNGDFIKNELILVVQRSDGAYMERIDLDIEATDTNVDYKARLDRRVDDTQCTVSYDAGSNTTTWTLPYEYTGDVVAVTRYGASSPFPPGVVISSSRGTTSQVQATGDYSAVPVYIGVPYRHLHEFSTLTIKDQAPGGGSSSITEGKLMLQYMTISYDNTGFFKAIVTPDIGGSYEYSFTGRIIGVPSSTINEPSLESGSFRFPVKANAERVKIELVNDTFLPSVFNAAEWEARYVSKARRI